MRLCLRSRSVDWRWIAMISMRLVEEHNQELTTEDLMELHCDSQQEVKEESLSEEEGVTAKQQSSSAIREMLKAWETVESYIEKYHPNKAVAMRSTHFHQILKRRHKKNWKSFH
ncbi:hypothetical protein AVEN_130386-1 [Araneus ventricosus]|uniref:Uncharacterized protein n=1 Tax=Araneus ventricosus TaxID=182803 RepID=A0A4Y2BE16_ARAVE|nr:hypothetical protein AVEN_130386-1 [Araneus ventricosus]